MQSLTREPFIKTLAMPPELGALCARMLDSDGLCACGRYLSSLDAKFILVNPIPSKGKIVVGAYCYSCFSQINSVLKRVKDQAYKEKRSDAELRG